MVPHRPSVPAFPEPWHGKGSVPVELHYSEGDWVWLGCAANTSAGTAA